MSVVLPHYIQSMYMPEGATSSFDSKFNSSSSPPPPPAGVLLILYALYVDYHLLARFLVIISSTRGIPIVFLGPCSPCSQDILRSVKPPLLFTRVDHYGRQTNKAPATDDSTRRARSVVYSGSMHSYREWTVLYGPRLLLRLQYLLLRLDLLPEPNELRHMLQYGLQS